MTAELLTREFHRIDKESLTAERAGNRPHSRPLITSHHPRPIPRKFPQNSSPISHPEGLRPHPALSAPFRIWVTVWVSPHPGGDEPLWITRFSSITNKNQPDLERSELIFCWILPTALAGNGFEPHDLRVMR